MTTLVIHVPSQKVRQEKKKSFDETVKDGIGDRYAISLADYARCSPGCKVVVLNKDEKKRAEGKLIRLEPREKAGNGMQRYDVQMERPEKVDYVDDEATAIRLTKSGYALF